MLLISFLYYFPTLPKPSEKSGSKREVVRKRQEVTGIDGKLQYLWSITEVLPHYFCNTSCLVPLIACLLPVTACLLPVTSPKIPDYHGDKATFELPKNLMVCYLFQPTSKTKKWQNCQAISSWWPPEWNLLYRNDFLIHFY